MENSAVRYALVAALVFARVDVATGMAQTVAVTGRDAAPVGALVTVDVVNSPLPAVLEEVARQAKLRLVVSENVVDPASRVSLRVEHVPAAEAFARVLERTQLRARIAAGYVVIARAERSSAAAAGTLAGRVTDAMTKRPLAGAAVLLDEATRGVKTGDDGRYVIAGVTAGAHRVTVRLLGHGKQTRSVAVADGETVTADFSMTPSAAALDQIVVTGTVIPTELKAVPNAITVITAKQIEERGITRIDQLFRGDVPGLFALNRGSNALLDEVSMFSRGATAITSNSAGVDQATGTTNPIKTYVDGVELADAQYLSQIDPKSIERIEILAGPQASTIYGSNAINGVMQIFTKRGTSNTPQLTLNLLSGWVENNFSNALTPQHDYSTQLSGIDGRIAYNAGGSWNYMGPWTPAKQSARTGGLFGARLELPTAAGRVTADMTLRRSITQSLQRGETGQVVTGYRETGWYNAAPAGRSQPTTHTLTGQTLGLTLSYAPLPWWSHELGYGVDASDEEDRVTAPGYRFTSDTALSLSESHADRRSLRYTTTARLPLTALAQATVTAGADAWQSVTSSMSVQPQRLTGTLLGETDISRQPNHNAGGFLQTQLAIKDLLFLTYGLRAEWNPGYGEAVQPNYTPRYGASYAQAFGTVTAKLRASYGHATRPPMQTLRAGQKASEAFRTWSSFWSKYYDNFDYTLPNPELVPERQKGGEGGLELYFGTRGSLVVTRYDQTVDDLIDQSGNADSVLTKYACEIDGCPAYSYTSNGFGYWDQQEYVNVGSIRNQGWELQGSANLGPFTTKGTYSWTKSRVIGVNGRYRAYFADKPWYQPGGTFQNLPEHTWALGVTYARGSSSVGLNLTGTGQVLSLGDKFFMDYLDSIIRLPQNLLNVTNPFGRATFNSGYALADLTASHRFAPQIEGLLQVRNLADRYTNDYNAMYAIMGRQSMLGLRVRF